MQNHKLNILLAAAAMAGAAFGAYAQSAVDAYTLCPTQLRGSARFVAMGGAFTSLGGDISTMTQNPAGIGVYRRNDLGTGFSISVRNYNAETPYGKFSNRETRGYYDYFGYVGSTRLNGALRTFNWGVSYNRLASYDRRFEGYNLPTSTSLSNCIASYTELNKVNSGNMLSANNGSYDPYLDSDIDWLSILGYNAYMINNNGSPVLYTGLYTNGTTGDALYTVRQRGYVDEYNIDFGGNINDLVYWGVGVGIMDMSFTSESNYSESMENALIYTGNGDQLGLGNAGFDLVNTKYTSGTGANIKAGVIIRPVEMLRLGLAVHTPTWMHLTNSGWGDSEYNYTPNGSGSTNSGYVYTPDYEYNWRLNTPWRFMVGASLLIGNQAIVSLDYERVAYNDMKVKHGQWNTWGQDFVSDNKVNDAIRKTFKGSNIIRLGIEYRLTSSLFARAGFNYQTTNVTEIASTNGLDINTAGTDPSYIFDKDTYNICFGLGYRYKAWYIDATYQHTNNKSTYHAYTPFGSNPDTPSAALTTNLNNIILSTGFKF